LFCDSIVWLFGQQGGGSVNKALVICYNEMRVENREFDRNSGRTAAWG